MSTYAKFGEAEQVAQAFGVTKWTVYRLLKQMERTGSMELRNSTRGRKTKIEEHHNKKILGVEFDITLDKIRNQLHLNCSITIIYRAVKKNSVLREKKIIYACEQKRPAVIKQGEEMIQIVQSVNPEKLVFIDKSSVNTDFTRNYGRLIGKSRVVGHMRNTPKNTTVVSSFRLNGDFAH